MTTSCDDSKSLRSLVIEEIDEESFGELVSKLRICLQQGRVDDACFNVRDWFAKQSPVDWSWETSVHDLGIPIRMANAIESHGYRTLGSLRGLTAETVLSWPNCGRMMVEEIRKVLRDPRAQAVLKRKTMGPAPQIR